MRHYPAPHYKRLRLPDLLNLMLGLALFCSPLALGYAGQAAARWNAQAAGLLIGITAVTSMVHYRHWKEGVNLFLGAWIFLSPFTFGFAVPGRAFWTHLLLGFWVAVIAVIELSVMKRWPRRSGIV